MQKGNLNVSQEKITNPYSAILSLFFYLFKEMDHIVDLITIHLFQDKWKQSY